MRHCGVMELLHLLRRLAFEPDSASVGKVCRFAIDWLAHTERTTVVPIKQAHLPGGVLIAKRLARSKNGKRSANDILAPLKTAC